MKKVLFLLTLLLLLPLISGDPPFLSTSGGDFLTIGVTPSKNIPVNETFKFHIHILNETYLFSTDDIITCHLHIYDGGTGEHLYKNDTSIIEDYDMEFIIPPEVHNKKGQYSYKAFCNSSYQVGIIEDYYYVSQSGLEIAGDNWRALIYIMFILGTLLLFYFLIMNIAKIVLLDMTVKDLLFSWSSFLFMLMITYFGREYLLRTLVEDLGNTFLNITAWTNIVLPVIAFIITIFVKGFQKKRPLNVGELNG